MTASRLRALYRLAVALLATAALAGAAGVGPAALAATPESTITADTTWSLSGSPYTITTVVSVQPGATLTVDPGVELRFGVNAGLSVAGGLRAEGSAAAPIRFVAADAGQPGWRGLVVAGTAQQPASLTMRHVELSGASNSPLTDGLSLEHARASVADSSFQGAGRHGIYGGADARVTISNTSMRDNTGYAIDLTDLSLPQALSGLSATGNGQDVVAIGGTGALRADDTWENPGLPYLVIGQVEVRSGATLSIAPGVEVRFAPGILADIKGALRAEGTAEAPITLTGATKTPGSWRGLSFYGTVAAPAAGTLRHVTLEYGGQAGGGNIYVNNGQVAVSDSVIRRSASDGVMLWSHASGSSFERSQIVENAGYGIFIPDGTAQQAVLAANNWWGAPSGPQIDNACNPGGAGARVSGGVIVTPFLGGPDADPAALAPADAALLSITPQRWFARSDGAARIFLDITLVDGAGRPMPGRKVRLHATLGDVVDGGITDVRGHTYASISSLAPGDSTITALLELAGGCEYARSAATTVSFTPSTAEDELMPGALAPYVNGNISAAPLPLVRGVPTTLSAQVTNPGDTPLSVEGSFGFAQSSIGLTFGPLGSPQRKLIPPHSSVTFTTPFTPPIEGHYCFSFDYSYGSAGAASLAAANHTIINFNFSSDTGSFPDFLQGVNPGPDQRPNWAPDEGIDASLSHMWRRFTGSISLTGQRYSSPPPLPQYNGQGLQAAQAPQAAAAPVYQELAAPRQLSAPLRQPGNGVSAARASAENAGTAALIKALVNLEAAATAQDRYRLASRARDLQWASLQASAQDYYSLIAADGLAESADAIEAYVAVLKREGVAALPLSLDGAKAYQQQLKATGFSAAELAELRQAGLSDSAIEEYRQQLLALAPEALAGDLLARFGQLAAGYRAMAGDLRAASHFGPAAPANGLASAAPASSLARAGEVHETLLVGNPLGAAATIDLRVRPINLPPDWIVQVSPASLSLQPGQQQQVSVTVLAGTAVQGSLAQFAVEGYADGALIDGVAYNVPVPQRVSLTAPNAIYLPLLQR